MVAHAANTRRPGPIRRPRVPSQTCTVPLVRRAPTLRVSAALRHSRARRHASPPAAREGRSGARSRRLPRIALDHLRSTCATQILGGWHRHPGGLARGQSRPIESPASTDLCVAHTPGSARARAIPHGRILGRRTTRGSRRPGGGGHRAGPRRHAQSSARGAGVHLWDRMRPAERRLCPTTESASARRARPPRPGARRAARGSARRSPCTAATGPRPPCRGRRRAATRDTTSRASSHIQSGRPSCPGGRPMRSWKFVCVNPGHTAVTVTPRPRYRPFAQRLKLMSQPLHAPYVERGMNPATEAMFTMRPLPRCSIGVSAACVSLIGTSTSSAQVAHLVVDVVAREAQRQPETGVVDEHVDRPIGVGQPVHDLLELSRGQKIGREDLDRDAVLRPQRPRPARRAPPCRGRRERGRCGARRAGGRTRLRGRSWRR